jgi:hypothetical protein
LLCLFCLFFSFCWSLAAAIWACCTGQAWQARGVNGGEAWQCRH